MPLLRCGSVTSCICNVNPPPAELRSGVHLHTKCGKSNKHVPHDKIRDVMYALYRHLRQPVRKEANGLYCVGKGRPADLL